MNEVNQTLKWLSAILTPLGLNFLFPFCAHFLINLEMSEAQKGRGWAFQDPAHSVIPVRTQPVLPLWCVQKSSLEMSGHSDQPR